jgi:hypothetical protein
MTWTRLRNVFLSALLGALGVVCLATVCYLLPRAGIRIFLFPGQAITPIALPLVPASLGELIAGDEGGPAAAISLFLFFAAAFWWLVFSSISYALFARRRYLTTRSMRP